MNCEPFLEGFATEKREKEMDKREKK